MMKDERELRKWALWEKGEPFFVHPAIDRKGFFKDITALIRAVRADERSKVLAIYEGMTHPQNRSAKFIEAIRGKREGG